LRLSNLFGKQPLAIGSATVAYVQAGKPGEIENKSSVPVHFKDATAVTVPPGTELVSDEIAFPVEPLSSIAVSLTIDIAPNCATSHPGARSTSFLLAGNHAADEYLTGAESFAHWYFLSAVEVAGGASNGAVAALGDSITDGHGATTDGNDRWTDVLAARLVSQKIAVLNLGIGGNRILADGIGPSGVSRFERDALGGAGVHTVIFLEGVNDLGGLDRVMEHPQQDHDTLVNRLETAMKEMVEEAHQKGVCVLGGTLTPYVGSEYYHPGPRSEADRVKLNAWIRTSGVFDGVVDFDKALSDPAHPDQLAGDADSGDHLHPGPKGYSRMGQVVPLDLLTEKVCSRTQ
jgi:lysophospholipase L1-like esterase